MKGNIIDILYQHAQQDGDKIAFSYLENGQHLGKNLSYSSLYNQVEQLAQTFHDRNLQNKRALLVFEDTFDFIETFLACQYLGVTAVPIYYTKTKRQLSKILGLVNDAEVSVILTSSNLFTTIKEVFSNFIQQGNIPVIQTDLIQHQNVSLTQSQTNTDHIAFIQYTSGSTGNPKGVMITTENLMDNQRLLEQTFSCNKNSVILSWLPFHHDMGLIGNILHTIYVGCHCILMSPLQFMQKPQNWLRAIKQYKVTHSGGPNFAYDLCCDKITEADLIDLDLSSWQVAYNGSEPIRLETINKFTNQFNAVGFKSSSFSPCYGLAEATLLVAGVNKNNESKHITFNKDRNDSTIVKLATENSPDTKTIVSSGKVASGIDLKIIAVNDQTICDELVEGEICIAGDSITKGYWKKDNSTFFHEINEIAYLKTGDLGFLYQGELFVSGRIKEMLIIRGKNYYPYDIESNISKQHTAIRENGVAVFSLDALTEQFVIAVEITRQGLKTIQAEKLIHEIETNVVGTFGLHPYDIILTTPLRIPRTTSGKIQRLKCATLYTNNEFKTIGTKLEITNEHKPKEKNDALRLLVIKEASFHNIKTYLIDLIEATTASFDIAKISSDADLAALGLDSIRAMELINKVNKDLEVNLNLTSIYNDNTLDGLIRTIENLLWLKGEHLSENEITI